MQATTRNNPLELPDGIRGKLESFRQRVWFIKLAEGAFAAAFGLLLSYLLVFGLDRVWDTPAWLRVLILIAGAVGLGVWLPLQWHRWVWRTRRLEQVARLLRHRFPRLGDQLLGIVELVRSELEQERSEALCRAAMQQVDDETRDRDFNTAVPNPRHIGWAWTASVPLAIAAAAMILVPAAGTNALARWLMPWRPTERYTFAQIETLPEQLVVPYAEPFSVDATLAPSSAWSPSRALARYGEQPPVYAELNQGAYAFPLPPQTEPSQLSLTVGDAREVIDVVPTTRPELTSLRAQIRLPEYLQYAAELTKDVRGGSVSLVKGSQATFEAVATRDLAEATVNGTPQQTQGNKIITGWTEFLESAEHRITWQDNWGLAAKEPFVLSIQAQEDAPPTLSCRSLASQVVLLDEEVLSFEVLAADDFGVKSIGMEWLGIEDPLRNPHPSQGEKLIASGEPERTQLDVTATFSARREGIKPQSLQVRLFADDYLPDRERIYSPTYILHVLSPEEHAIWLTQQLRKWLRQAQHVYEREQQLYATNKELRSLSADQIDHPQNRRRIETQAAAERANARQLQALTGAGETLIQHATRNDQFNVATLETWAQMLQSLKDIAANRMPSVADLLKGAASAPGRMGQAPAQASPAGPHKRPSPSVGVNRDGRSAPGEPQKTEVAKTVPSIVDVESGFNELDSKPSEPSQTSSGRLTLPTTAVQGGGLKQKNQNESCPIQQKVEEAVEEQEDLLAEFAKVAAELQKILNNLEGSTFVKRLKAASRRQLEVAGDLNRSLNDSFGVRPEEIGEPVRQQADEVAQREVAQSDSVYIIQEDLEAYFNRVQQGKFKTVLNEMKSEQVVGSLRGIADTVRINLNGQSIAQTEYWADALDRWAEQLVGPG